MQVFRFRSGKIKGGKVLSWSTLEPSRQRGLREEEPSPARGPGEGSRERKKKKRNLSWHSKDKESSG